MARNLERRDGRDNPPGEEDRVAIIEHGRLIAMGSPADLVRQHCPERRVVFSSDREDLADALERTTAVESVRAEGLTYTVQGRGR
jgi:hypothetical protein